MLRPCLFRIYPSVVDGKGYCCKQAISLRTGCEHNGDVSSTIGCPRVLLKLLDQKERVLLIVPDSSALAFSPGNEG